MYGNIQRGAYARSIEGMGVEWDRNNNFEHIWEQVKRAMVQNAREVCGSVRGGREEPKESVVERQVKSCS